MGLASLVWNIAGDVTWDKQNDTMSKQLDKSRMGEKNPPSLGLFKKLSRLGKRGRGTVPV